jgi:tetratricopeptide (TPR) repeat protein
MKRKLLVKPKQSAAKPKKINMAKSGSGKTLQMTKAAPKSNSPAQTPQFSQAVQNYEGGLRALQERKFDKAKAQFQKVIESGIRELSDRASVHLNACNQHLARTAVAFKTPEEHYDYAISLMNVGDYVTAREHLEKLVKTNAQSDYIWYGLAVLDCLTGHSEDALKRLSEAIRLNPSNRFQARSDSDFNPMADDPRFTELLYPEPGAPEVSTYGKPDDF